MSFITKIRQKVERQRMLRWTAFAFVSLVIIAIISPVQLNVILYKLSLVSIAVVLGYHLDRVLFPYSSPGSYLIDNWKDTLGKPAVPSGRNEPEFPVAIGYELIFAAVLIRRAMVVSAVVLGVTMGL
ncbi:Uncharacterised protein [Yersinia aldovae]|uniref:putative holin n=1 Tax=Yersinia aldovae TaxID=29483 RepID=UPI0005E441F8|nr:putative holin [Yersinia aldovae]CNJ03679.1 Uncharacterised protein [Yersinia aldovae]